MSSLVQGRRIFMFYEREYERINLKLWQKITYSRCSDKLLIKTTTTKGENNLPWNRYSQIYGEKVWETLPAELKKSDSLQAFKRVIKAHKCYACNCRSCKIFHPNLGFLL